MAGTKRDTVIDVGEDASAGLATIWVIEVTDGRAELVVEAVSSLGGVEAGLTHWAVRVSVARSTADALSTVRLTGEARLAEGWVDHVLFVTEGITSLTLADDELRSLSADIGEVTDTE